MTPRRLLSWCGLAALILATAISVRAAQDDAAAADAPEAAQTQNPAVAATTAFQDDVHASVGLKCEACHRTPTPGPEGTITYAPIPRTSIPELCARCHSDAIYMRQFAVQVRVDQYAQYQSSVHGQQLAQGDDRVATCSDCHGAHGIRQVADTRSSVAPPHVAQTCARCHSDADRMTPYGRSAEVVTDWSNSVHAAALLERGDTSAPTCNTCHGSHGATPPGIDAVANVCAQCHVREAELFRDSIKGDLFDLMGLADCLVCHSNHRIEKPDQTWIGTESPAVCAQCHDGSGRSGEIIGELRAGFDDLLQRTEEARAVLTRAEEAGMLVDEGNLALHDADEAHIRLRVTIHGFALEPYEQVRTEGVDAADRAMEIGTAALGELNFRRRGLGIATLFILGFLATLWFKIRKLPAIEQ